MAFNIEKLKEVAKPRSQEAIEAAQRRRKMREERRKQQSKNTDK